MRPQKPLRARTLAGAAICALLAGTAYAQDEGDPQSVLLSADELRQDEAERVTAEGNVELVSEGNTLRAQEMTYDPASGVVTATGDIRLYRPDGSTAFADTLIVDEDLVTGVATGFSARLPENATIAAANVIQRDENFAEMNRAIFTTCELCREDGTPKDPTWSISAEKVVRDEADKSINYRNAVIRIGGVPVLYTPFFSHADPSADRKSGLLAPRFQHTDRRGLTYEQPFLWSISPYQDLIISPQLNTEVNPFLNLEWRKRFYTGLIEARGGYTYERDFNEMGREFGPNRSKAYILAAGAFEPGPLWDWGFTAEAARDRRLFDQYSISYQRADRGLYVADDRRLISQVYTVRQSERSYFSVAALAFQSLRPLPGPPGPFGVRPLEDNDTLPIVAPLVEFRYEPEAEVAGGRLRVFGSGAVLTRDESPLTPGAPGTDSRRASAEIDWRRAFTLDSGVRLEPFAHARADLYNTDDLTPADRNAYTNTRAIGTIGLDASWPLIRIDGGVTTTVEPIAQIALSPDADFEPEIPNEDSLAFVFDYTNLFEINRLPGFDVYEGGQRLNLGVRTTVDWGAGRHARVVVGQSFRADADPTFPPRTGLDRTSSDWVLGVDVTPVAGLSLFSNARFDDFDLRRVEAGVNASLERGSGYLRYLRTESDFTGAPREDVEGAAEIFIGEHWGVLGDAVRDLENNTWRHRAAGLVYQDDCLRFELLYQRDNNPVLGARESSSVLVRLTLATLGEDGYTSYGGRRARGLR